MAETAEGAALTVRHQRQIQTLRSLTLRDLIRLWRGVDVTNLSGTIGPFTEAAALLIRARFADSSGLAAGYFRDFREAEGVAGTASVIQPDPPPREIVAASVRGAGLSGIVNARKAGFSTERAAENGLVKVAGAATSLVLAGSRQLITEAAVGDRRSRGWRRVTSGENCKWCNQLAGVVFPDSVDFQKHDHCDCSAEPAY